ncbi:hypothetical protein Pmani_025803 [Petrolisthes manimaculis]|uniref:WW domain-containing protein n=1 Tax=Petrolisthes manimaculis TaxID=1843537 RepID=A0AAE1TY15_9EUCA|nr:hypothetical protein Pmani_025803 [Petrolisthes manimaculis]
MPLPPALAARLAKRGILSSPKDNDSEPAASTEEEIIAEDYDDTPQQQSQLPLHPHLIPPVPFTNTESQTIDPIQGWPGCPNKWNVYHECSKTCKEQWGEGGQLDPEYIRRKLKMLVKYPLPNHWQEILDPGIRRCYYWNTETDLVSWLPPGHTRCQVSRPAATLRREMATELAARKEKEEEKDGDEEMIDGDDHLTDNSEGSDDEGGPREVVRGSGRRRDPKDRRKDRKSRADPDLDPMDPASYGECGRGTWSSGLPQRNEARTGADGQCSCRNYWPQEDLVGMESQMNANEDWAADIGCHRITRQATLAW